MATTVESLYADAINLPEDSRLLLAEKLWESLTPSPEELEAQLEVVRRRIAELESGAVVAVPGDVALKQVREAVASRLVGNALV
jgi:putative addiction module component (TIGR02574 family)